MVNVLWALLNLVAGYLLFRVGRVCSGREAALIVFFAGIAALSILCSMHFAKKARAVNQASLRTQKEKDATHTN